MTPPRPRGFGAVNWAGLATLVRRGLVRFLRMIWGSLGGPAVSSLLFLAVFVLAAGRDGEIAPGLPVVQFVAPGIVMFALGQAAFENAAFPVLDDKLEGMIGDLLAAPLAPWELLAGYVLPAACNALAVGGVILLAAHLLVGFEVHSPALALMFAAASALLFALIGTLAGLWADRWEHYSVAETFIVLPLGFLSGTFFTLASLPGAAQQLIALNPVFYAIDGFRFALTGFGETSTAQGIAALGLPLLGLALLAWRLFATGYKLKP